MTYISIERERERSRILENMSIFVASFHQLWVIGQLLTWIHIQRPWQQGWLENPCQKSRCVPRDFPAMVDCREGSQGSVQSHVFAHPPGGFPANIPPQKNRRSGWWNPPICWWAEYFPHTISVWHLQKPHLKHHIFGLPIPYKLNNLCCISNHHQSHQMFNLMPVSWRPPRTDVFTSQKMIPQSWRRKRSRNKAIWR